VAPEALCQSGSLLINVSERKSRFSINIDSNIDIHFQLIVAILTASWEPSFVRSIIHPSRKIIFPDLTISLPATLLCLELAFVSILHFWAFPQARYDIRNNPDPNASYDGNFLGWKAFFDALNPWDIAKAIGRGLRWTFVGRRHREQDISYEEHRNAMRLVAMNPPTPGGYLFIPKPIPLRASTNNINKQQCENTKETRNKRFIFSRRISFTSTRPP
jgi:hypothetical protein